MWDMLCLTVLSGMIGFFRLSFFHLIVEACVLVVWLSVHVQFRKKVLRKLISRILEYRVHAISISETLLTLHNVVLLIGA